jgi:hypothetical protein
MNKIMLFAVLAALTMTTSCKTLPEETAMKSVRTFAGFGVSESQAFKGTKVSASATVVERADHFDCVFVFYSDAAVPLKASIKKKAAGEERSYAGTVMDPRGFPVEWTAKITADGGIVGTYKNPQDHGSFSLKLVKHW